MKMRLLEHNHTILISFKIYTLIFAGWINFTNLNLTKSHEYDDNLRRNRIIIELEKFNIFLIERYTYIERRDNLNHGEQESQTRIRFR